jgi:hypothetical protein
MSTLPTGSSNAAPSWVAGATNAGTTTLGQISMVNLAAQQILNQGSFPTLTVPGLTDLNAHLTIAQGHANTWRSTTRVQLSGEVDSLIRAGGTFQSCYDNIKPLLPQLGNDKTFDPAIKSQIVNVLAPLQVVLQQRGKAAKDRYGDIRTFHGQVMADAQTFASDYDKAFKAIGSKSARRNQLTARLDALQTQMNNDDMTWGFGAAGTVVGGLVLACGLLLEIPTAGVSTGIVVAGAAIIAAGVAVTAWGVTDRVMDLKEKANILGEIADDDAEVALIKAAQGHLEELSGKIDTLNKSVQQVLDSWQDLDNGLGLVLSGVKNPEDRLATLKAQRPGARPCDVAVAIAEELEAADDAWENALPILNGLLEKNANVRNLSVVDTKQLPSPDVIAKAYASAA